MAKDMSRVYSEMLTKELVQLRAKHIKNYQLYLAAHDRKSGAKAGHTRQLIEQINHELASRIASFNLFV